MCLEDEVMERATIEFPEPLNLDSVEELFVYLTEQMDHCSVDYTLKLHKNVGSVIEKEEDEGEQDEQGKSDADEGLLSIAIHGFVRKRFGALGANFSCIGSDNDPLQICGMRFLTIPGYELKEHRKDEVAVWDEVRENVNNYFLLKKAIKK